MYEQLAGVYDDIVGDLPYPQWAAFAHEAWSADEHDVRTVLDVCCGTGLMSAELLARGYDVSGTDGSPAMLAQARALLGPDVPLVESVLPSLTAEGSFDAAVCSFDSLNYLAPDAFSAAVAAIAARLRPGGWLVLDLHTATMMHAIAANPVSRGRSGALTFDMVSEVDVRERTSDTRIVVTPEHGEPFVEEHHQHFFTDEQVRAAAGAAGLAVVSVTDDYGPHPVGPGTLRSTWVLRVEHRIP